MATDAQKLHRPRYTTGVLAATAAALLVHVAGCGAKTAESAGVDGTVDASAGEDVASADADTTTADSGTVDTATADTAAPDAIEGDATLPDVSASVVCGATPQLWDVALVGPGSGDHVHGLATTAGNIALVAGETKKDNHRVGWLQQVQPDGTLGWSLVHGKTDGRWDDVAVLPDGGWVAAGYADDGLGTLRGWAVAGTSTGNVSHDVTLGTPGQASAWAAVLPASATEVLLVGQDDVGANADVRTRGWVSKWNASTGQSLWTTHVGADSAGAKTVVESARALTDGGALIVGSMATDGQAPVAWLARIDAQGTPVWEHTYGQPGEESTAWQVAQHGAGWALVAMQGQAAASGGTSVLYFLDETGKVQGQWSAPSGGDTIWRTVQSVGSDVWVGGMTAGAATITRVSGTPAVRWSTTWPHAFVTRLGGSTADTGAAGSTVWAMWHDTQQDPNNPVSRLRRTDLFGNASCADAGACADWAASACDTASACAADHCAAGQCTHPALPNSTPCAAAKTCQETQCAP